ncbi:MULTISPECIES: hypothetical protein [unclassified Streptomyces]|uniref:hypothetical protein n=1 Tax=unclassified Streptomyces TaxID=2593676 RepID=UPI002DD91DEB|nr:MULTISPECIES: hypothetical protein [unclassified Streptomyces]WSA94478.1 hypothetical protein OIE63_25060 [Streptomyces sp. NBC_01795]WSB78897.1 hypothetical protein OHB04_26180 [Streptomyces sp. NBC_01775]WSS12901.1 hypothetical protein OG533_14050 [Streptomyces sp. NBC_01186]WSS41684.1 hypothetical protein OG220_14580 [Streptomyces sp. NBC_01187]
MPPEDSHSESLDSERRAQREGKQRGRERREREVREHEVRVRVGLRLRELSHQLDRPSYDLLLRVLGGVNTAFTRRNEHVELEMTPEERALYTPELQRELVRLLELASFPRQRVHTDDRPPPDVP